MKEGIKTIGTAFVFGVAYVVGYYVGDYVWNEYLEEKIIDLREKRRSKKN